MSGLSTGLPRLSRHDRIAAPVRHVHLGLGAFFRAHQADYTDRCPDAEAWGIAAFAGRRPVLATELAAQDGLYTLVRRYEQDDLRVVRSVRRAHAASERAAWRAYFESPEVAVVTLTVTEAGYPLAPDGTVDLGRSDVRADLAALRSGDMDRTTTVPGRILSGLVARQRADAGPMSIVPCDNLPGNGAVLGRLLGELATLVGGALPQWLAESVATVSCLVDRITPATTDQDVHTVAAAASYWDACPVVTEPYSEWVLGGDFRAPRPAWERAGAVITADLRPYEERKLWLLNGAHSLLAYAGSARGHQTVAQAMDDAVVRSWVEQWWDEAGEYLAFPAEQVARYRADVASRFTNPRIAHSLAQIAADGSRKLPVRILPVLGRERAANRMPLGAVRALAGWVAYLHGAGPPVVDPVADQLRTDSAGESLPGRARRTLAVLDPALVDDGELLNTLVDMAAELEHR
jgi:fructuronate reductase